MSNNFIKHITLENYKSIKNLDLELKPLNVLIGSNGAGKSNFISFFNFLQNIIKENLRNYVLDKGGCETFLHFGIKNTATIKFSINYKIDDRIYDGFYSANLKATAEQFFRFTHEEIHDVNHVGEPLSYGFETNIYDGERALIHTLDEGNQLDCYEGQRNFIKEFKKIQSYHLNDTSDTSPLKATVANNDNLFLRADGQNLACMIKLIYDKHPEYYKMIIDTIRNVVPDFYDFVFRHNSEFVSLEWFNKNNVDIPWKAHYLSDGSLRFIAQAVLLLMPSELQPQVIIIDEPEIGLHPTALNVLSGLIKRASLERQVIISTQSATLLSQFEPDDVIVVDKKDKYSEFKRLSNHDLAKWLESHTLGELWETNVIGGRP
jgi:predicted ATPase